MADIFTKLDSLFVDGAIAGITSILIYCLLFMMINKVLSKIIDKQTWKYKVTVKRIKSIVLNTLLFVLIVSQITFMKDLSSTLLASGGIVAVVVGLASQEAAGSIVSGMMILASKPFQLGDTIILKEHNLRGTVKEIKMNHTVIETLEKNTLLIPNTIMNKAIIENVTQEADFKTSYLYVDVAYESDLNKAIAIMQDVILKHPLFMDTTTSSDEVKVPVHCMEFKDSGISLRAKVTTKTTGDGFALLSDCRILIKDAFDQNGIEIPYPHLQVIKKAN